VASYSASSQTFGEKACHPERSEGMTGRTPLKPAHGKPSLQMSSKYLSAAEQFGFSGLKLVFRKRSRLLELRKLL